VVGRAIETNPLIAAIAQITPATLTDIAAEIKTTEDYLAGLKTMHQVGAVALGLATAAPVAAEVVEEPEVAEAVVTPAAKPAPRPAAKPAGDAPVMSHVLRAILAEQPAWSNDQVIDEAKRRGVVQGDGTIRTNLYQIRTVLKKEKPAEAKPAPAPKPVRTGPVTAAQKSEHAEKQEEAAGLPPKDSPLRAEAELTLRKVVVEYLFKKGRANNGEIIRDCKVGPRIIGDFMTHEWFEQMADGFHRLTLAGKNQVEM
jgi:hypothetical protein